MKLFSIGETEIRVSPYVLLLIPAAAALGGIRMTAVAIASLAVHEAAHAFTASRLGYQVGSVEIQPFGFIARLDSEPASVKDAAAIYAAGPAASLSLAAFSALFEALVPQYADMKIGVTEYNLLIAAVNMIPALPLDGGRLVYSAFSGRGRRRASKVLRASGVLTGSVFLSAFALLIWFGAFNPTFLIMGVFLIAAALSEREKQAAGAVRTRRVKRGKALPVHEIAVSYDTGILSALGLLPANGFAVISVVKAGERIAEIDEARLTEAAAALGPRASLEDAVALFGQKMV